MSQNLSHKFSRDFNEEWIAQIRKHIYEDDGEEEDFTQRVCIFKILKLFLSEGLELYIPQKVSIGPYHYLRDEFYGMEKFKLYIVKGIRKKLSCSRFEQIVEQLKKFEMRIRTCYDNFLDFKSETLALMMAIDACFLIEIMNMIDEHKQKGEEIPHLIDFRGYKLPYDIILQDFAMLENQIPLFVVRKVLEPLEEINERQVSMILKLCKELSPFNLKDDYLSTLSELHLLDFLYLMITNDINNHSEILNIQEEDEIVKESTIVENLKQRSNTICNGRVISVSHEFFKTFIRKIIVSGLIKFVTTLSWKLVSSLPPISLIKQPIEYYLYTPNNEETNQTSNNEVPNTNKSFIVEEIKIPSISDLIAIGINFSLTNGGFSTICFDSKTKSIFLPQVHMKTHTEVVLKNLIAYEALAVLGPMIITRYTELMNGMIDTEEDVRILRENDIIVNYLKSDSEVVNIWNGMRKSIKSTKVHFLDKMIDDINEYYESRWRVKAKKIINLYVFDPWKFFIFLGIFFFFLLMMIQTLFSIYRFI